MDYEALRRWSVEHVDDLWQPIWDYFGVRTATPQEDVVNTEACANPLAFDRFADDARNHA